MSNIPSLNAPSYMPTLFGSISRDASLLSALSGHGGEEPNTVSPLTAPTQAGTSETKPVSLVAARQAGGGGNGTELPDLTTMVDHLVDLVV